MATINKAILHFISEIDIHGRDTGAKMDLWSNRKRMEQGMSVHERKSTYSPIERKTKQYHLRWFGHVLRRPETALVLKLKCWDL